MSDQEEMERGLRRGWTAPSPFYKPKEGDQVRLLPPRRELQPGVHVEQDANSFISHEALDRVTRNPQSPISDYVLGADFGALECRMMASLCGVDAESKIYLLDQFIGPNENRDSFKVKGTVTGRFRHQDKLTDPHPMVPAKITHTHDIVALDLPEGAMADLDTEDFMEHWKKAIFESMGVLKEYLNVKFGGRRKLLCGEAPGKKEEMKDKPFSEIVRDFGRKAGHAGYSMGIATESLLKPGIAIARQIEAKERELAALTQEDQVSRDAVNKTQTMREKTKTESRVKITVMGQQDGLRIVARFPNKDKLKFSLEEEEFQVEGRVEKAIRRFSNEVARTIAGQSTEVLKMIVESARRRTTINPKLVDICQTLIDESKRLRSACKNIPYGRYADGSPAADINRRAALAEDGIRERELEHLAAVKITHGACTCGSTHGCMCRPVSVKPEPKQPPCTHELLVKISWTTACELEPRLKEQPADDEPVYACKECHELRLVMAAALDCEEDEE